MSARANALTRAEILDVALAIADEQGLQALSMRALAKRLGVEAMSLYHHFPNKDAILDGLAASVMLSMRPPASFGGGWEQAAEESCAEFRRVLLAHPNLVPIMIARPFNTGEARAFIEGPVGALVAAGIPAARAQELFLALVAQVFGHVALATLGEDPDALGEGELRRAVRALIAGYDAEARAAGGGA